MRRAVGIVVVAATLGWTHLASAEIVELATRVGQNWTTEGATVVRAPTRFLYEEEVTFVPLAPPDGARCVSVALVAARGLSFHGSFDDGDEDDSGTGQSVAGTLELATCGALPTRLRLESDAGRGAVEIVVAYSKAPASSLRTHLPERLGGILPPMLDPGPAPPLPPQETRADAAEARSRAMGASLVPRLVLRAGDDSSGAARLELAPGCHEVHLFAKDVRSSPHGRGRVDLDAELRDEKHDETIAKDGADAPDVTLEGCVGAPTAATLHFDGAIPGTDVVVVHGVHRIPDTVPAVWGASTRARLGEALRSRHVSLPTNARVAQLVSGTIGTTWVRADVEPGGCYVAAVAARDGGARTLALQAHVGERESADDHGAVDGSAVVAFCAGAASRAQVGVDFRGTPAGWALVLYRVSSGIWEVP